MCVCVQYALIFSLPNSKWVHNVAIFIQAFISIYNKIKPLKISTSSLLAWLWVLSVYCYRCCNFNKTRRHHSLFTPQISNSTKRTQEFGFHIFLYFFFFHFFREKRFNVLPVDSSICCWCSESCVCVSV